MKKYICSKCKKESKLPIDMEDEFKVCENCASSLIEIDNEKENNHNITKTPSTDAKETIAVSKTNPSQTGKPVRELLCDLSTIEKYSIQEEIGRGAMSTIMSAVDKNMRRKVAIKLMPETANEDAKTRFLEEAQVIGQLEHPNIVPIHDIGIDEKNRLFFTMKYVNGRDLDSILSDLRNEIPESKKEYSQMRLIRSIVSVCNAIAFAHSKGVIHRDLKPANIMIGDYGEVLVMDWGIAMVVDAENKERETPLQKHMNEKRNKNDFIHRGVSTIRKDLDSKNPHDTLDGHIIGTPLYMSPEQARGENSQIDRRSDIYSLGALLYEILTLKTPVEDGDIKTVIDAVCNQQIVSPKKRTPERQIPKELEAITMKALSYSPHNRYQKVSKLRNDINRYIAGYSVSAKPDSLIEAFIKLLKRNKAVSIVIAIAIVILVAIGGISRKNIKKAREKTKSVEREKLKAEREKLKASKERLNEERVRKRLESRLRFENRREWRLVFSESFDNPNISDNWIFEGNAKYEIKNNKLHIFKSDGERRLTLRKPIVGDIKIEFECYQKDSYLNDVTCFMSSMRGKKGNMFNDYGYIFQYGGNNNTRNSLQREGGPPLWSEVISPLKPNKIYHVRAEKIDAELSMTVNEKLIFKIKDPNTLAGPERSGVGIYSFGSDIWYDNIRIYKLGSPRKVDIMTLAQRYLRTGYYQTSIKLFHDIINSTTDIGRRQEAKLWLKKAKKQMELRKTFNKYMQTLAGHWQLKSIKLNIEKDGFELTLSGEDIRTLRPLINMEFKKLTILDANLSNLNYINRIKIDNLIIKNTPVKNLSPLKGHSLKSLTINNTHITDLTPLFGTKLESIDFEPETIRTGMDALLDIKTLKTITTSANDTYSKEEFKEFLRLKAQMKF